MLLSRCVCLCQKLIFVCCLIQIIEWYMCSKHTQIQCVYGGGEVNGHRVLHVKLTPISNFGKPILTGCLTTPPLDLTGGRIERSFRTSLLSSFFTGIEDSSDSLSELSPYDTSDNAMFGVFCVLISSKFKVQSS